MRKIYEHLLQYDEPIKLRQHIKGSRDLAILRSCSSIYHEAIQALYDLNSIMVTRNDFCRCTDAHLKTPLKLQYARHILVSSFSQSIACTLNSPEERCDVCQPSAIGLVEAFQEMPRLRTVLIDYHKHLAEMRLFRMWLGQDMSLEAFSTGTGSFAYRLEGPGLENLDIQFRCGRFGCAVISVTTRCSPL